MLLVVGTRNRKKREEILDILGDLGLDLRDLTGWPDAPEVVEDADTFEGNARKKAVELARYLKQWVLGEDSGLVVPALNGRPGVYSARYAGKQGDDAANNARLLAELAPLPDDRRAAYYVCTAALSDPEGNVRAVVEGRCHGVIFAHGTRQRRLWVRPTLPDSRVPPDVRRVERRVKHALSHRGRALGELRPVLRKLLG